MNARIELIDHDMISTLRLLWRERDLPVPVHAELVERLFTNSVSIAAMGLLFAMFGGYVASRAHDPIIDVLVLAATLASTVHLLTSRAYWRHPPARRREEIRRWEIRYGACGCVSASLLGLTAARVFAGDDLASGMVMTALILGYASGTMARTATRPWISAPRILLLVIAPTVVLESRLEPSFAALGLLFVLFTITGLETMISLYAQAVSEIGLRLQQSEKARQDPLTGLANRRGLDEFIEAQAAGFKARAQGFAVFCLDLDRFKVINDQYGHPVGDALLKAVALRLTRLTRPTDLVARLGGDEFMLVQTMVRSTAEVEAFARRIVDTLGASYDLGRIHINAGVSVGVAISTGRGGDIGALLVEGDAALYASKSRGRGTYTLHDVAMAEMRDGAMAPGGTAAKAAA